MKDRVFKEVKMKYSKIKSVEIWNFMAIEHAKVLFDERNVLNIKGYNDSGKSALLRAMVVAMMNMFPSKQAKFIKFGKDYFRIVITFDDGFVLIRDKYKSGKSLYELWNGEDCLYTNKANNLLTKIVGVPEVIEAYLGLCPVKDGEAYLNYQSNVDPLLLVDTTGSENYRVLHEVLKAEEIYRANAMINSDRNQVNGEIMKLENSIFEVENALEEYKDLDETLILSLMEKDKGLDELKNKSGKIDLCHGEIEELMGIKVYPKIEEVGSERLEKIIELGEAVSEMSVETYPRMGEIDIERFTKISELSDMVSEVYDVDVYPEVEEIEESGRIKMIGELSEGVCELIEVSDGVEKLKEAENKLNSVLEKIVKEYKLDYRVCKRCGGIVEV